jgi:hypothetical protein
MTAAERELTIQRLDATIGFAGLFARALAYSAIAALANQYDCGRAILTGILAGDLSSRLVALALEWSDSRLAVAAELLLLGLVFLCVRSWLWWPDDQAERAIVGLAGFGVFAGQVGGSLLTRLGPGDDGWS